MNKDYQDNRKKLAEMVKTELPKTHIQEVRPIEKKKEKEEESHVNFWIPSSIMEEIKIISVKNKKTIKQIAFEAFIDLIAKYK